MDSKGFIQLFNTKWSNTNLHYSKSAYSSYAIALVLCETWTDLSEHSRQILKLTAKAIPEGPFQSTALTFSPLWLIKPPQLSTRAQGWQCSWGHSPSWTLPGTAVTSPAQPWPLRGHTHSPPHSLSTARAGMAQLSQAGTRQAREIDGGSSEKSI